MCTGHLCADAAPGEPALTDPEGGNIIFEYIYFDTQLVALGFPPTANRVMAYFMNSQTPNSNTLPTPGVCNNLETTNGWPLEVGNPHVDLDVGALTFSGRNEADQNVTITPARMAAGLDGIGRPHDIFYQAVNPDVVAFLKPNSLYDVSFGGAGTIPATTFTDAIFLAEAFTLGTPGFEQDGPLVAGTDFTVTWNPATSSNLPAGDEVLGVTWLVDLAGSPTHMCPTLHSAGTFTIPGATIAEYQAVAAARGLGTTNAILLRNAIVHKLERLPNGDPNNERRIDMLSVFCWAQLVDVQP